MPRVLRARSSNSAERYRALHRGNDGDVQFYVGACEGADSVLEYGCGSGRILGALAAANVPELVGVDTDQALLDLIDTATADRDGVRIVCGDMRTIRLSKNFDRVLFPYNTLYCMRSEDDVLAALSNAMRHLNPGGRVVLDLWNAEPFHHGGGVGTPSWDWVTTLDSDDGPVEVYERLDCQGEQRLCATYRSELHGDPVADDRIEQRYVLPGQLRTLLDRLGATATEFFGDFEGTPFDPGSEHLVVVFGADTP